MVVVPNPPATSFLCPGERHAIPRSVHLARLGRSYAACATCPQRHDSGLVPLQPLIAPQVSPRDQSTGLQVTCGGIRGRYLNDLDRGRVRRMATLFARQLWEARPRRWRNPGTYTLSDDPSAVPAQGHAAPERQPLTIVVGYDERPSSPDLAIGVVTGCVQAGCRVIDLGRVSRAMWTWAARHFHADGGVLVTGIGREWSWSGCDWLGAQQQPIAAAQLEQILVDSQADCGRPTRTSGSVAAYPLMDEYVAQLRESFHALRPLKLIVATASDVIAHALRRVRVDLPCTIDIATGPEWHAVHLEDSHVGQRLAARILESGADAGFWIDADGQRLRVFSSNGEPQPLPRLAERITQMLAHEFPDDCHPTLLEMSSHLTGAVGLSPGEPYHARDAAHGFQPRWLRTPITRHVLTSREGDDFSAVLSSSQAAVGFDEQNRLWLTRPSLQCDAVAVIAATLRLMSWVEGTLAELLAETTSAAHA